VRGRRRRSSCQPDIAEFGWALAIGLMAAALGCGIRPIAFAVGTGKARRKCCSPGKAPSAR